MPGEAGSLSFTVHRGDGAALLCFDVDEAMVDDLAGFAITCEPPRGKPYPILNRLSFEPKITSETTPAEREWTPSDEAPIQKFHWIHYPTDVPEGTFAYRATAMLFRPGSETEIEAGPSAEFSLALRDPGYGKLQIGFTRGYISSQGYADKFHNADFEPARRPPSSTPPLTRSSTAGSAPMRGSSFSN